MVQIRKILDFKENKYPYKTLRFYCNWVLHIELSKGFTTELLSNMLEPAINSKKSGHDNALSVIKLCSDFFKIDKFKKELELFNENHGLFLDLSGNKWWEFASLLLGIIEGSTVHFKSTVVSKFEVIKHSDKEFYYKLSLFNSGEKPIIKLKLKSN